VTPGPRPKPRGLKLIEGNPGRRRLPNGAKPRPIAPEPPEWLSDAAREEWDRLAPEIEELGLLTGADRAAFAGYCSAYASWVAAEGFLAAHGATVTAQSGYLMPHPMVAVARHERAAMHRLGQEFGLTPFSRSRIDVPEALTHEDGSLLDGGSGS